MNEREFNARGRAVLGPTAAAPVAVAATEVGTLRVKKLLAGEDGAE